jgi:hypothetical protein
MLEDGTEHMVLGRQDGARTPGWNRKVSELLSECQIRNTRVGECTATAKWRSVSRRCLRARNPGSRGSA